MRTASYEKVALSWTLKNAKNLPPDVERYVQEGKDSGMEEGQAWAIAWSRYCKYKNPGSDHCQMNPSEYFSGKTASKKKVPRELILGNWKTFLKSAEKIVESCTDSLLELGFVSDVTPPDIKDEYEDKGAATYMFEYHDTGKWYSFYLILEGELYKEEVIEGDDSYEVMAPPYQVREAYLSLDAVKKFPIPGGPRGKVTPKLLGQFLS